MNVRFKRGKTIKVEQITTGEVFMYDGFYYMKCLFVTENNTRLYWAVNLFTGSIVKDIPDNTLVEVFDEAEVIIK